LQSRNLVPIYILYGLNGLEYVIFALDVLCLGYSLVLEAIRFLKSITATS